MSLAQLPSLCVKLAKPQPLCVRETLGVEKNLFLSPDHEARLRGALNHIMANMMDHGIEEAPMRRLVGKSEQGLIRLVLNAVTGPGS